MATVNLKDLARRGAAARVGDLLVELATLFKAFPELRKRTADDLLGRGVAYTDDGTTILPGKKRRRRKPMSAAQRRAVGIRMKKYWAARRKASK
jgi:hypothetical protein